MSLDLGFYAARSYSLRRLDQRPAATLATLIALLQPGKPVLVGGFACDRDILYPATGPALPGHRGDAQAAAPY